RRDHVPEDELFGELLRGDGDLDAFEVVVVLDGPRLRLEHPAVGGLQTARREDQADEADQDDAEAALHRDATHRHHRPFGAAIISTRCASQSTIRASAATSNAPQISTGVCIRLIPVSIGVPRPPAPIRTTIAAAPTIS